MSQLMNTSRSVKPTMSSPPIKRKSQSTLISVMKLKQPNRRASASLAENSAEPYAMRPLPHHQSISSTSKSVQDQRNKAREIIHGLQRKNIKLLAIDFDHTFLSIHTGGYYQGTVENLSEYIRPTFYYLLQEILDSTAFSQTLHVCIVSFSPQEDLIRKLLQFAFKTSKTNRIIIRCNTPDFIARQSDDFLGKECHISSVVTELATRRNKTIKQHEILLLDDDIQNILIAEDFGHKVLEIRDEINLDILKDFTYNVLTDN